MKETKREETALAIHAKGANCAQSVLLAFSGELGLDETSALRIATGFGAGMGRTSGPCGAVTGACMALGLARGMSSASDAKAKDAGYGLVAEFIRQFREANGGMGCTELLGVDLGTAEGRAAAKERGLHTTRCNDFIRSAVAILEKILKP